ncbi:MAG TPA: hypothetical protein VLS90_18280, partial [Thermodesulfobacteriota bacterium]|nr:hypothetical protein [Thermodesulfobacteriota bacterium]
RDLLVMGPDCGTAIIRGVPLGFANRVRRGKAGLVGASGTGLQEVAALLHQLGFGVSHAIGTGSNDVSEAVGGVTMIQGIRLLEADDATEIIVVVSKPPAKRAKDMILEELHRCSKPVVANFLGENRVSFQDKNILFTVTLEETAFKVAEKIQGAPLSQTAETGPSEAKGNFNAGQKYIRGLFTGGTLATEAAVILRPTLPSLSGNISLSGLRKTAGAEKSAGHAIIDLGAEEFTLGKPHPMLEPEMRRDRLLAEAKDPEVKVLLMDFVLGYGVHPDPVGATLPMLREARDIASKEGRNLVFLASICGTDEDPQNKPEQARLLREAGILLCRSNAQAAIAAARIIGP